MLVVAELCGLLESKMDGSLLSLSIFSSLEASAGGSWWLRAARMSADGLDAQISILYQTVWTDILISTIVIRSIDLLLRITVGSAYSVHIHFRSLLRDERQK
jgi:hypothetical protein